MNNSINKKYYYECINLVRNLSVKQREDFNLNAFNHFIKLYEDHLYNYHHILFIAPSLDELNIDLWIKFLLTKINKKVYGLHINVTNNYQFVQLDKNFKNEWFINRYQFQKNHNVVKLKEIKFDLIILPIALFNEKKQCLDNELNIVFSLINKLKNAKLKPTILGYSLNLNQFELKTENEPKTFEVDYLITNNYIL